MGVVNSWRPGAIVKTSVNLITTGFDNGVSPLRHQTIP